MNFFRLQIIFRKLTYHIDLFEIIKYILQGNISSKNFFNSIKVLEFETILPTILKR